MESDEIWTEHFRRLENLYRGAPINRFFQPELVVRRGEADVKIPIRDEFFHAGGATHGSVYFKAADDAAYFAANSVDRSFFVLTVTFNLTLLRPIKEGIILARGRVIQKSTNLIIAESILYDSREREIGRGNGTFARSGMTLSGVMGYL